MLTRKEKLLFFCLGRETTPYEAAEIWEGQKGTEINMGPWYACKSELEKEKLIGEIAQKGRKKLIRADLSAYLNRLDENVKKAVNTPLFEKYAPRIVDFMIKYPENTPGDGSLYYPVMFFLATKLMIGKDHLQDLISSFFKSLKTTWGVNPQVVQTGVILSSIRVFIQTLSKDEVRQLQLGESDRRKIMRHFMALVQLAPAQLTKKILIPMLRVSTSNDK